MTNKPSEPISVLDKIRKKNEDGTPDTQAFLEASKEIAAQDPAMADIMSRMVDAELAAIGRKKS